MGNPVNRRFVETRSGRVHMAEAGSGAPVLLLHQTPRSWDEYRDALPLIGRRYRAIAMDTRGFGDSDPLAEGAVSIERWADAVIDLADALGLNDFAVAGHHTGGVIALDLAARYPNRINRLVLSATSYIDADRRARHAGQRVIDEVEQQADGQHLTELWQRRRPHYPAGENAALLTRFMRDALKAGPLAVEGHRAVNRYRMEDSIGRVCCPTLILAPMEDPHAYPSAARLGALIAHSVMREIPGAMVPFPDQMPQVFADAICAFLDGDEEPSRR